MADHCVLIASEPPTFRCLECRCVEAVELPQPIDDVVALADRFAADHRACGVRWRRRLRRLGREGLA